jgi:hypothetical protein
MTRWDMASKCSVSMFPAAIAYVGKDTASTPVHRILLGVICAAVAFK